MSKEMAALFGGVGSVLGFAIGVIIELSSPDGFSCLPSSWPTETQALNVVLQSCFMCWIVVLICAGILGALSVALAKLVIR